MVAVGNRQTPPILSLPAESLFERDSSCHRNLETISPYQRQGVFTGTVRRFLPISPAPVGKGGQRLNSCLDPPAGANLAASPPDRPGGGHSRLGVVVNGGWLLILFPLTPHITHVSLNGGHLGGRIKSHVFFSFPIIAHLERITGLTGLFADGGRDASEMSIGQVSRVHCRWAVQCVSLSSSNNTTRPTQQSHPRAVKRNTPTYAHSHPSRRLSLP